MNGRGRLHWRCRRGMLELDLLLLGFLDHGFDRLTPPQQQQFEQLLQLPDNDLLQRLMNTDAPDQDFGELPRLIRQSAAEAPLR